MKQSYDIVIVGGGMVGASMAGALGDSKFKIAVVEAFASDSDSQPSFDERTVALTWSSKLIFSAIGVWQGILDEAWPIVNIEVTSQDALGLTALGIEDTDTEALGYVVPTRRIGQVLHKHLRTLRNVDFLCPATVESITARDTSAQLSIQHKKKSTAVSARLVILADGGRSGLLEQAGFTTRAKTYSQSALAAIIASDKPHHGKAYEHFTGQGPLALLPVRERDYALAWTLEAEMAGELGQCDETEFLTRLQTAFGRRAGRFTGVGRRGVYPLSLSVLDTPCQNRIVVIGNAAHIVHPVAGQGFNLGLRDVGFLHQLLEDCDDPGDPALLTHYADTRRHDTRAVSRFTDGLIQTFNSQFLPLKLGRSLGLSVINLFPLVKRGLLKRTMGLQGRQSRLAMRGKQQ